MKRRIITFTQCLLLTAFTITVANAQVFNGGVLNQAGNSFIPSTGTGGCAVTDTWTATSAGLTNQMLNKVTINLTHTFDGDLLIYLQAPNGEIIELSTGNGGGGDNYTNTVFMDGNPSITSGSPPYTGTFSPEGTTATTSCAGSITPTVTTLGNFTAGQNGNWTLIIKDQFGGDSGTMLAWSIEFVAPPPPPTPCAIICPANLNYNLDPGACTQVVNYDVLTTGTCEVVDQACGFVGTFDPSSVDAWQVVGQSGMGPVPAGNNKVIFSDAGAACPAPFDQ
ncbi:MAG: proprotein convertase P-domain-containing protein, partial [Lewinellaceae bacterium]|nr:proprotein convertase P-domain-containing protein [Lewinellaceae bacterium]